MYMTTHPRPGLSINLVLVCIRVLSLGRRFIECVQYELVQYSQSSAPAPPFRTMLDASHNYHSPGVSQVDMYVVDTLIMALYHSLASLNAIT